MKQDIRNRRVIDNLNETVLLFDADLRLFYVNPAGEMLFELSSRQLCGRTSEDLFSGSNPITDALITARDNSHALTEREVEVDLSNRPATVTLDCTVTPILEPKEPVVLLMELQQIDRQLRIVREENLLAQQAATHAVVRGLAHEINNPLGGLRGAAQLLERELPNDSLKEYTSIIIGEADRLQNLLGRLLGPSSLLQKRLTNIHEVLERVRSLVLVEIPDGIRIKRDYDPSIPDMQIDPDQIIQAVLNIVRNAVQALDGKGEITLRTRTRRQFTIGTHRHRLVLQLDIVDNGPGIPDDMLQQIFYPMVTGRAEGTGLGLAISQSLVNKHDGIIECQSRPGKTTFTILLPLDSNHD